MEIRILISYILVVTLAVAFFASPSLAAGNPFTALGQVTDASGNPVPGAEVTLIDGSYKVVNVTKTNADGNFGFTNVVAKDPSGCKVTVNFTTEGKMYNTSYGDMPWYSIDSGIVKFDANQTRLRNYTVAATEINATPTASAQPLAPTSVVTTTAAATPSQLPMPSTTSTPFVGPIALVAAFVIAALGIVTANKFMAKKK